MVTRLVAWVAVVGAIYGTYTWAQGVRLNPFTGPAPASPVIKALPPLPDGCTAKDADCG